MKRIAVIGQSGDIPEDVRKMAEAVGGEIAKRKAVLLTGGGSGVMEAASKGAKEAGGLVIGILAGDRTDVANDYLDVPITTGLHFDFRSLILVHSSDALIMIRGGNGTLGELSAAYMNRKPVVIIETTGGWAAKIKEVVYEGGYLDERRTVEIAFCDSAEAAVDLAFKRIEEPLNEEKNTGRIGD
ncbi:TIGR00725 family protein [Anoxybacillus sp. J5B_2022]|uniref:TIGR00725 family protein n=1 Tax=Anoxybacillus sp. J5B_2022 TaxID=3003246 RepID=UPI0022859DC0|nr:TIGR00725 family protein [Anoxybacillus sp. J5B_2022]MCZ0754288.1 TIGR00725 family protein [Anoxybacillus sp. J5B_2022]